MDKNDHLPKSICLNCWTKLKDFHDFYIAVGHAKNSYLADFAKTEPLNFIEINCDFIDSDDDSKSTKNEPNQVANEQNENARASDCSSDGYEDASSDDASSDDESVDVEKIDDLKTEAVQCDVEKCIKDEPSRNDDDESDDVKPIPHNDVQKSEEKNGAADVSTTDVDVKPSSPAPVEAEVPMETINRMLPNHINMNCDFCKIPFGTLTDVIEHYQNHHNQHSVFVRCCRQRLQPTDIVAHIRIHINPENLV